MKRVSLFSFCVLPFAAMGCAGHNARATAAATPEVQQEQQPERRQEPQPEPTSPSEGEPSVGEPVPAVLDVPAIPAADTDTWNLAEGVVDRRITLIRYRPSLGEFLGHPAYPRRLAIAWTYGDDGKSGLPTPEQAQALNSFEDRLVSVLDPGRVAVLAFIYTSRGVREWNFYVSDVRAADLRINAALRDEPGLPIELTATNDPTWGEFKALLDGVKGDG